MEMRTSQRRRWRRRFFAIPPALILAALAAGPGRLGAAEEEAVEYAVKAAFLVNFTKFVEWPAGSFPDAKAPFVMGILGKDPFGKIIDAAVVGKKTGAREITLRRLEGTRGIEACHILFIASSEAGRREEIRRACAGKPILTVAEFPDFAETEGTVEFVKQDNKVRLEINIDNAREARLKVSANLLRIARTIEKGKD
jgi:hypothetical protein